MLDLVCIICHEAFGESDDVYATHCGHIFHQDCIRAWFNDSQSCPQCRRTGLSTFKLYLESALMRSDNANLNSKQIAEILHKQELEMYEEVNLNLTRDLAASEEKVAECEAKLICLQVDHEKVQDGLLEEIQKRENCEKKVAELEKIKDRLSKLDQSLQVEYIRVQNDLKAEMNIKKILEERVAELDRDKLDLTEKVNRLETQNKLKKRVAVLEKIKDRFETEDKLIQYGLTHGDEKKENTEQRIAELEKKLEREIGARQLNEKLLTPIKKDKVLLAYTFQNSNPNDDDSYEKKEIAADAILFGIPYLPCENLEWIFKQLCRTIECIPPDLKAIYRDGKQKQTESPIIVKFISPKERNAILKAMSTHRKKINRPLRPQDIGIDGTSTKTIYMRENLTTKNRLLLEKAFDLKHHNRLFSVYTQFGSVYVKQTVNGPSIKIDNAETLNGIANTNNAEAGRFRFVSSTSLKDRQKNSFQFMN